MRQLVLSVAVLASGVVVRAADDLTALKPPPGGTPPRKLLHAALIAECEKRFAARTAEVEKLKTPADVAARQKAIRETFVAAIGGWPEKTPLNPTTVGTLKRDGYTVEKVIYESRPEHHVTANLYLPTRRGRVPGVLMPVGHSPNGKAAEYMQRGAVLLAKNGIAALVYDPIGQGERSQLLDTLGRPAIKGSTSEHTMCGIGAILVGRGTASYRIWDGIRSLDYLASRPEIDAKRLGCTGCSGGGTLTSYLMALDDRIVAAAPSCYLTTLSRLFATLGPQDAEQNITGQVAFGMDHADYVLLHAPKPTLVLASTRDFFDITGTWTTFREAKRVYTLLGRPEQLDIIEADATHGYPKSHREAMARFMCRWLAGEDRVIVEENFAIEKDATLLCTRTGQVLEDLTGKSVFDLNAAKAGEYAKARAGRRWEPDEFRDAVARVIGLTERRPVPVPALSRRIDRDGYRISVMTHDAGAGHIPVLLFDRDDKDRRPLLISVHEDGKAAGAAVGGPLEQLVKSGKRVMALDVRGVGETAPAVAESGRTPPFGVEYKESVLSLHLDRPLLGQRVSDVLTALNSADATGGADLVGVGVAGPIVLHAAAIDPNVKSVTLEGSLVSWESVVRTPISHNQLASAVPGALKTYDLPDLAKSLAPRPLTIRNPVDAAGKPLTRDAAEEVYRPVREAYRKANAEKEFTLTVEAK